MKLAGSRMDAREGFSIFELVVVMTIIAIVAAVAIPNVSRGISKARSQGAATVIASEIQLAHSMAARQRTPIQIVIDTTNKVIRLRDFTATSTVYSQKYFNASSENPVQSMVASSLLRTVYPNGLADGTLTVTVNAGGQRRLVTMTRVGQVRVTVP